MRVIALVASHCPSFSLRGLSVFLFSTSLLLAPASTMAGDQWKTAEWPAFRGPNSDGIAPPTATPPITWSEQQGVIWRLETTGRGWSTPVVWNGTAWFTAASEDGKQMWVTSVDLETGEPRWRIDLFENDEVDEKHNMNSYASPSPVTDGRHVWVHFGSYGTACLDAASGKLIWQRRDLPCNHWRGPGSSPILVDDLLIVHYDGYDYQYVVALNQATGETVWKVDRDIDYGTDNGDYMKAYCTPQVIEVDGQRQLISPTSKAVLAYAPLSGEEIWRVTFDEFSATAMPLWDGQRVYVNTGFGKAKLYAIDPRGQGDITNSNVQWINTTSIGSKPSQLLTDGRIYNVHDQGVATCVDAATGETLWKERLGGQYSASILLAGGHLYLFDHDGICHVLRPGPEFQQVAENQLDDGCMASPVPLGDKLLVRTRTALYLLGSSD